MPTFTDVNVFFFFEFSTKMMATDSLLFVSTTRTDEKTETNLIKYFSENELSLNFIRYYIFNVPLLDIPDDICSVTKEKNHTKILRCGNEARC